MEPLFPPLPENLSDLSADELRGLISERLAIVDRIVEGDTDLIGERTPQQVEEEMTVAVTDLSIIRDELGTRTEETDDEATARRQALAEQARAAAAETTPEPEQTPPDPEPEAPAPDPEPEQQPAQPAQARRAAPPAAARENEPAPAEPQHATVVAAAGIRGVAPGTMLSPRGVADALIQKARSMGQANPGGDGERLTVAVFDSGMPADRHLVAAASPGENMERIQNVTGPDALTAAGGLCAPVETYYGLADYGVTARPVRDALATFTAERGGIKFATPPKLTDVSTAVGTVTAANDALGGTNAAKTCQRIVCPSFSEVDVYSVYHCITGGNLGARAYPEQVEQFTSLVMQLWARTAEQKLLDAISAASTAVTYARQLGAVDTLAAIITAGAGMRNRHRMAPDQQLQVLLPAWLRDAFAVDDDRADTFQGETDIAQELREANITPSFYIDGGTGASQMFGAQSAGALLRFPATAVGYLFAPGSFLWLDSGQLELGLVRDSTLNAQNDYQLFGESWENIAFVGVESLKLTIDFCATGAKALRIANTGC